MYVLVSIIVVLGVIVLILCLVGYSVIIDVKELVNVEVIVILNYVVLLEGVLCVIIVWYFYFSIVVYLLWVVNYYVGFLVGVIQCILMFIVGGDLQLLVLFQGMNIMIWYSDIVGKGIMYMVLENVFDNGDFQLFDFQNQIVYYSFGVLEFVILFIQKFM